MPGRRACRAKLSCRTLEPSRIKKSLPKPRQIFLTRPSMVLSRSHELTAMTIRRGRQMLIKTFTLAAALTGSTASIASAQTVEQHNGPGGPEATGRAHHQSASAAACADRRSRRIDHNSDVAAGGACQEKLIKESRVRHQRMPSVSGERLTASLFHVAVRQPPTNETDQASCLSSVSRSWSRVPPPHLPRPLAIILARTCFFPSSRSFGTTTGQWCVCSNMPPYAAGSTD